MAHPLLSLLLAAAVAAVAATLLPAAVSAQQNMTDAEALMQLKKSFTNSSSLSSWLITSKDGDKSPCSPGSHEWHGVVCGRGGTVTGLRLNGLHLGGTIDVDALAAFRRLRSVSFAANNFSGQLPAIDRLTALKSMYLSDNQFTGVIPDEFFGDLNHLKKLWLDGNDLSGEIPASIAQATSLLELRLERNAFSGELPPLPPPALKVFDISDNDLDGVVPEAFRKFDAGKFAGNRFLCYVPTADGPCTRTDPDAATSSSFKRVATVFATLFVSAVVLTLALRLCCGSNASRVRDLDSFHRGGDEMDERPPVYMMKQASSSTTGKRSASWLGRRTGSSLGGGGGGHRRAALAAKADDLGGGDLVIVNNCKGVFGLTDLMKAAAEVIGSGGLGSAYKAVMANGVAVVVKRARDMNRATKDAFEAEMRRLGATRHANLLPPLAYHYRRDEKLLVYEYIPKGSLLYVLHGDRGMDYAALDWPTRLKVAAGVARGTAFLHAALSGHEVPHGNLKSANILLAPDFEPLLVDFGFSGLITHDAQSPHSMFAHRVPECAAGGVGAKADVYCLGVVLLELLTGKFPSQYLHNAKGGTDLVMWATSAIADGYERDLFDPAIMAAWKFALPDMTRLMLVAVDCVETDVDKRPGMKEAAARVEEVVAAAMATVRERQQAAGDAAGGVGAKADVYCLGVVLLELLTGKFPSQYLHNAKGGTDLVMWATSAIADGYERDLFDPAIMAAWKFALPDMTRLMLVAVDCVETDVDKRPGMKEAAARVEEVVAAAMATVRERQQAAGDAAGGVGAKADVYCLGVVLLELLTGKFPSQYLHNAKGGTDLVMWATSAIADGYERDLFDPAIMAAWKFALPDMTRLMLVAVDCVETDVDKRPGMKEAAARVEEVVAAAMATVRERQQAAGDAAGAGGSSRSSHAQYVRDGSMQRITSVGERSSRRGSNDYSYGIS